VTEARMSEDRMLHDAVHDHLTGLPNRRLFLDRLDATLAISASEIRLKPVLLLIDIDRFQNVNDALGLSVGDSILLTVSRRMSRLMKPQDTLARLAGDRFAAILVSETDEAGIDGVVEMLTKAIVAPVTFADREIFLTASIGIAAAAAEPGIKRDALIKNAELALSNAKRKGGDAVIAFDASLRNQRGDRFQLENDLRRAVERGEMRLVFQPIVRLEDRTIAGFEALLRWDHPRHGRLPPSEFIGIAEETGQIAALGLYALDRAAQELLHWQEALAVDPPLFASVNVSSRQLLRHDLLNDVRGVLAKHKVHPGTLKLEITESLVMENPEFAAQILTRIRDLGAGLSLDDFGTGYSSLSYLQRFPFDTIKIDKSFVRQDGRGGRPVILRTMISLAHDLGMTVVAEGAETEGDTIELYQYGCEYAQGFVFGEPMTAEQARNLVSKKSRGVAA
jgi:diguanylate cyclase (GGDEF)-like protein